jgi:(1->4)-alpha-D-glucan 1-alpha-D-glucosylmutase
LHCRRPDIDDELVGFIGELLTGSFPGAAETEFAVRFGQLSAPVMAKGVEDTAFYRYQRLISP